MIPRADAGDGQGLEMTPLRGQGLEVTDTEDIIRGGEEVGGVSAPLHGSGASDGVGDAGTQRFSGLLGNPRR
jgi:hypothetical protein